MKLNTYKFHLLLNSQESNTLKIGDLHVNNSLSEKLLGITFDCKLKFNKHIEVPKSITELKRTCKTLSHNLIFAHYCRCAAIDLQ